MNRNTAQLFLLQDSPLLPSWPCFPENQLFQHLFPCIFFSFWKKRNKLHSQRFPCDCTLFSVHHCCFFFFFVLFCLTFKATRKDRWIDRVRVGVTSLDLRLTSGGAHSSAQIANSGLANRKNYPRRLQVERWCNFVWITFSRKWPWDISVCLLAKENCWPDEFATVKKACLNLPIEKAQHQHYHECLLLKARSSSSLPPTPPFPHFYNAFKSRYNLSHQKQEKRVCGTLNGNWTASLFERFSLWYLGLDLERLSLKKY